MKRMLKVVAGTTAGFLLFATSYVGIELWQSRPLLDGELKTNEVSDAVQISTDAFGIPSIVAHTRQDAYFALGYVSARDRMFQMDLLRRASAGRLAEIFGADLIDFDRQHRQFGFSMASQAVVERLPAHQLIVIEAYARGINAWLDQAALPPEFAALGYAPEPWRPQDTILVVLGMFETLANTEVQERSRTLLARCLTPAMQGLMESGVDPYTQALLGQTGIGTAMGISFTGKAPHLTASRRVLSPRAGEAPRGSNAWAVAGFRTKDGRAILANDMHLDLGVPNIWYRAQLRYGTTEVAGVVLPGIPAVVVGSNGHVAWGLTSLDADVLDLVKIERDRTQANAYKTPQGLQKIQSRREVIAVSGQPDVEMEVETTIWGPVMNYQIEGHDVALHWSALDPQAVDLGLLDLEHAGNLDEALTALTRAKGPPTNVLLADHRGRIGWTVTGLVPRRRGHDGAVATSWADGQRGWDGYLAPDEVPRLVDPESGFLINGNQRMLPVDRQPLLGRDFGHGYRAYRIRERLLTAPVLDEAQLFAVQLDTRSEFFDFYRDLALEVLDEATVGEDAELQSVREEIAAWDGLANVTSRGLPVLVRFRRVLVEWVYEAWFAGCKAEAKDFELSVADVDTPLQRALKDPHVVASLAATRPDFLRQALRQAILQVREHVDEQPLAEVRWGDVNRVRIEHPLGSGVPGLGWWLNMPEQPLDGCSFCVRMAAGTLAASQRMVVSPGHESEGFLHAPAGQSGHPLSDHYDDQQEAWREGRPLPFLPGERVHTWTLAPHSQRM